MTFFNAVGLFLASHLPPMIVILVLSGVLAILATCFTRKQKRGPDL